MSTSSSADAVSHENISRTAQQKRRLDDADITESDSKRQDADIDIDEAYLDALSDIASPASEDDLVDQGERKRRSDLRVLKEKDK